MRIVDWRRAVLTLVLSTPAFAQTRPPAGRRGATGAVWCERLVEKGSDLDKALRAGNWERAEQLLVKKIEAAPQSAELLKLLARVFLADRRPLNAAIAIKKAEAIAPLDSQTRYQLAIAYLSMNHGDWARPELERLAQADPTNPLYQYWLGRVDYDAGHYASAAKRFEAIVEADDTFMKAFDNLGLCYEALNQPEQAIGRVSQGHRAEPNVKTIRRYWPPLNLGTLLRTRGELREAEALLREAMKYDAVCREGALSARCAPGAAGSSERGDRRAEACGGERPRLTPSPTTRSRASTVVRARPKRRRRRWQRSSACTMRSARRRRRDSRRG